jgi:hypothetical protein
MVHASLRILCFCFIAGSLVISCQAQTPAGAEALEFNSYHSPQGLIAALNALNRANPAFTRIHAIGRSPGGRDLLMIEIGPDTLKPAGRRPAVLVAGNLEGSLPIASEAALFLAREVIAKADARRDLTWYILPAANPDGLARFSAKPRFATGINDGAHNDDMDDATDEDGPDDLDGNGIITEMRVKDPAGEWMALPSDPRILKRADPAKGEKGIYKVYTEGIDNDGDGEYNEDGYGGTDVSITFPHLFHPFTATGGQWPGSEPETYAIMQFAMSHPEIAMTFTLGATNMCLQPPAGGRKGSADLTHIKIPEYYAKIFGADPNATYTMQEVMDLIRPIVPPGMEVTEARIASLLGLGAVVNPLEEDLKYYRELSERYKDFLKQNKLDGKRLEPAQPRDGSFELWSYYQLGVPTFSMDLWTLPEAAEGKSEKGGITPETLTGMSNDEFLALGETKLAAFLKEFGAPDSLKPASLIEAVKSGKMTPKQISEMAKQAPKPKGADSGDRRMKALLSFSDENLQGKGFVAWTPFKHPTLGDVEIGGAVPYTDGTPPPGMIKALLEGQVPWIFKIAEKLPRMKILKTEVEAKGSDIYELTAWIQNSGELPFPTAMGKRNQHVGPAVLTIGGADLIFLSGKRRSTINDIDALKSAKLTWLIQSAKPQSLSLTLESANAWSDAAEVRLGGAR